MQEERQNLNELKHQKIHRLMWKYFVPALGTMILHSAYFMIDRIFIGQGVGAQALAGIGAIFPFVMLLSSFTSLLGTGGGVNVSINLGKGEYKKAEQVLGNAFFLMLFFAVLITILANILSQPILTKLGLEPQTEVFAMDYLNIVIIGIIFNFTAFSLNNIVHSEGNPRLALLFIASSIGLNILLDYIFIIQLNMGIKGAAYATLISQVVLSILGVLHFIGSRSVVKLRFHQIKPNLKLIKAIITIGFVPFAMHISSSLSYGVFNVQLLKYGSDIAMGAFGVIMSITMFAIMSTNAVAIASQPIISYNFGANQYARVRRTLLLAIIGAFTISSIAFLIIQIAPRQMISLFNKESSEMLRFGVEGLRIYLMALPLIGLVSVVESYFQSVGKASLATVLTLTRQIIIFIPILLMLPKHMGLEGVWMSYPLSDVIYATIVIFFLLLEIKDINLKLKHDTNY
ncbi:MAG: MATE family efflux transporter [Carboxylicivirga sp.]|jgi:putative MATE family efflux protein|nr:MATE family efflux transporter [Carboxylicivirga sp.]